MKNQTATEKAMREHDAAVGSGDNPLLDGLDYDAIRGAAHRYAEIPARRYAEIPARTANDDRAYEDDLCALFERQIQKSAPEVLDPVRFAARLVADVRRLNIVGGM